MSAGGPLWQIDIQKRLAGEYWTNVYHCVASTPASAQFVADELVTLERGIHMGNVEFVSYRFAAFPGPSEGTVIPIGAFGNGAIASFLPLFNVMRVDFPATSGRPSRKYYRQPVAEANQENGVWIPTALAGFQANFTNFAATPVSSQLVDVDGQLLQEGRISPSVGMRQLRRGSKRRLQPII